MKIQYLRTSLGSLALIPFLTTACQLPSQVEAGNSTVEIQFQSEPPANSPSPVPPAVCNPFGDQTRPNKDAGLWAQLYYLVNGQPHYSRVADYQSHGYHAEVDLFFNNLDVPTRRFDRGFMTQDGQTLKTPNGDTLYEWFSLHFEAVLRLGNSDPAGRYQFALLSDDGSVMSIDTNGEGSTQLINNDGLTPTRLRCASKTVWMDNSTRLPIKIDYFQGPRHHIGLILLWRQLPGTVDGPELADSACGVSGNESFFDYNQTPSAPSQRWIDLLGRGWKVLTPENFKLPDHVLQNPCSDPFGGNGTGPIGI